MDFLQGFATALAAVVAVVATVFAVRVTRKEARRNRDPNNPFTEELRPGEKPILDRPMYRQGNLLTMTWFGPLNSSLSDTMPKPPTKGESLKP